jgi:lipopolysaccharide/colanic/teichoic acid biosynthesis glycosyltransferase
MGKLVISMPIIIVVIIVIIKKAGHPAFFQAQFP